jgi:hypothetical protein
LHPMYARNSGHLHVSVTVTETLSCCMQARLNGGNTHISNRTQFCFVSYYVGS